VVRSSCWTTFWPHRRYDDTRDFPAVKGPSYLSVHLRFGTVSIRLLARTAHRLAHAGGSRGATTWLSELIWRDFYTRSCTTTPMWWAQLQARVRRHQWEQAPADALFKAWCEGRTGYPLVDAAMAQLNQTGYMHNRLRMVVASFPDQGPGHRLAPGRGLLCQHLNDFDLAANNGGWQWASSSGCDAQPYFPHLQPGEPEREVRPAGRFIRRYLPQLAGIPAS
jgi:deoxyribodipyrimidine photo-lyase